MYELVIIDDEFVMRDGMNTLINWEEIGFHVSAVCEDGAKGIEWIKHHKVDAILTDLRMGEISGIDVAGFVFENNLPIKVVIISGHSDFNAAQQAMELKVDSFLLKPISFKRIKKVFMRIYEELSRMERQGFGSGQDSLDNYILDCFVEDLLYGVLQEPERLTKYISWLGWNDICDRPCAIFMLDLQNSPHIQSEFAGELDAVIEFVWARFKSNKFYIPLSKNDNMLIGLKLDADGVESECEKILSGINALIGVRIGLANLCLYNSITEMVKAWPYNKIVTDCNLTLSQLRERQQIMITYMMKNDPVQAQNHYYAFINGINGDINQFRNMALEFFAGIVERLRSDNRLTLSNTFFSYIRLSDASSVDALRKNGAALVNELTEHVSKLRANEKKAIIENACTYINLNYHNNISLEQTAAHVFLSPVYFSKLFKEITGQNFKDYLTKKRISRACDLLINQPQMKVYDISQTVGYSNEKYFYQVFSRVMECTPLEYRMRNSPKSEIVKEDQ